MDERVMQAAARVQAWYLASLQTRGLTARTGAVSTPPQAGNATRGPAAGTANAAQRRR